VSTSYPSAFDTTANLPTDAGVGAQLSTFPHSELHGNANEAIIAIETELGSAPSGSFATVKSRIENIESAAWTTVAAGGDWSGNILYRKINQTGNIVFIGGAITWSAAPGSSASETVVTLPAGFRPATTWYMPGAILDGGTDGQAFQIGTDGVITKLGVADLADVFVFSGSFPI
jgi:hypothetical protein